MKNVFSFFCFLFPMFVVSCCNTQEFCCKTLLCDTALRKLSLMWCHCCFWRTWWLESSQPNATDYPLISLLYSTYSAPVWALYLSTLAALPWSLVTLSDSRFLRHWRQLRLIMRMYLLFNHSRRPCVGGRQYCNWPSSLSGAKWMSDQRWFPALVSSLFYFFYFFVIPFLGRGFLWWNCTVHPPPPRQVHTWSAEPKSRCNQMNTHHTAVKTDLNWDSVKSFLHYSVHTGRSHELNLLKSELTECERDRGWVEAVVGHSVSLCSHLSS